MSEMKIQIGAAVSVIFAGFVAMSALVQGTAPASAKSVDCYTEKKLMLHFETSQKTIHAAKIDEAANGTFIIFEIEGEKDDYYVVKRLENGCLGIWSNNFYIMAFSRNTRNTTRFNSLPEYSYKEKLLKPQTSGGQQALKTVWL